MEQLLRLLSREFRAFREQTEDRIKKLEANSRLPTPEPVVVPEEPEEPETPAEPAAPAVDPAANTGADASQQGGATPPPTDPASETGTADPAAADATKAKTAKGKTADAPADQKQPDA